MSTPATLRSDASFTAALVYGCVALWALFALQMGRDGLYIAAPHLPPAAMGLSILLPVLGAVIAYRRHGRFWAFCQGLDLRVVVIVHLWRLMAVDFLLCSWQGRLPAPFALSAGIGDILTALAALPLAFAVLTPTAATRRRFVVWNVFGLIDLILAVSLGTLYSGFWTVLSGHGPTSALMSELPRSLVPTFLVPLFMMLHLLGLARRRELVVAQERSSAGSR